MTITARLDPAAARAAAQQLYEERMSAVDALVTAVNAARDLTEQLVAAERSASRAYTDAQRAGWTDDDLKRIGVEAPSRRLPGRPAGARKSAQTPRPTNAAALSSEAAVDAVPAVA